LATTWKWPEEEVLEAELEKAKVQFTGLMV
jgi:hypothetical protein